MDRVGVAREVHRVHPVVGEVAAQPLDALQVGGEAVLHDEILSEAQHVRRVEQRFFLGRDEEFLRSAHCRRFSMPIFSDR